MLYNSLYILSYYKLHQTDNMTLHLWCLITSTIRQDTPFISCLDIMSQLGEYDTQCNIYHVSLQAPYSKIHLFYHFSIYHVTSRKPWYTLQHLSSLQHMVLQCISCNTTMQNTVWHIMVHYKCHDTWMIQHFMSSFLSQVQYQDMQCNTVYDDLSQS